LSDAAEGPRRLLQSEVLRRYYHEAAQESDFASHDAEIGDGRLEKSDRALCKAPPSG
jgi:hypothetical protein